MKRLIGILMSAFLLLNLTSVLITAQAQEITSIYTEAKTKNVFVGEDFDFEIYLSGTYDGYAINVSPYGGTEIKDIVPADKTIKADKKADEWVVSTMPGLECVDSEKALVATVTVSTSDAAIGELALSLAKISITDDSGDIIKNYGSNIGTVVISARTVAVSGVTLNKNSLSLNTGENETLIATVLPAEAANKAVTWKSSDTSVAAVDSNGKVTALKKGTAIVTATTTDGAFSASCTVSVACSHAKTTVHPAKASTCAVNGNSEYTTCDDCGVVVSGASAELPLAAHSYDNGKVTTAPACENTGVKTYTCKVCGTTKTETVPSLGHNYNTVVTKPACEEKGYTAHTCSRCGDSYVDTYTDALGHTPGDWELVKEAANGENGLKEKHCTVCGETVESEVIPGYIKGDVDGDGDVDAVDYGLAKRYCLGTTDLTEDMIKRGDLNGNGTLEASEYGLIKRHVLGTFTIV